MTVEQLKQLVKDLELANEFDNVEAERCLVCCGGNNGGNGC
jgi:NAD(P)H-hydrate repair Nnr-like enzyme with NAD(P)H-hydrate epimerase domain